MDVCAKYMELSELCEFLINLTPTSRTNVVSLLLVVLLKISLEWCEFFCDEAHVQKKNSSFVDDVRPLAKKIYCCLFLNILFWHGVEIFRWTIIWRKLIFSYKKIFEFPFFVIHRNLLFFSLFLIILKNFKH